MTKDADQDTITAGEDVGYRIVATNAGPGDATGFTITDLLPTNAGLTWHVDSQAPASPVCTIPTTGHITLPCVHSRLASGATFTVHIFSHTDKTTCATG